MATRKENNGARPTRAAGSRELSPTRRLVAAETARATVVAIVLGCAIALALDIVAMLVGAAVSSAAASDSVVSGDSGFERFGRGVVAAAMGGIVCFGILAGIAITVERLALADFFARIDQKAGGLKRTLLVRGQVGTTPFGPASASAVVVGSLALLAAIPCLVLAAEQGGRLDDETRVAEVTAWVVWSGVFLAVALCSAAVVWLLAVRNRRWAERAASRFGSGIVGNRGPTVRISSRAQRRAARRSWRPLEWSGWCGRVLLAIGAGVVFLGVYLRQPGLYADPVRYTAEIERVIDVGTIVGGVLVGGGLVAVLVTGSMSYARTIVALRSAVVDQRSVPRDDRDRVRTASTTLSELISTAQAWWAATAVVVLGWWFAVHVETPADSGVEVIPADPLAGPAGIVTVIVWLLFGAALIGARAFLQANATTLRNRFGYEFPTEPDDREYPNLTLFGQ